MPTILEPRDFFQPTETLGEVRVLVDEHLGRDDRPERVERLEEVRVRELLRQVVDEEVGPVRALVLLQAGRDPGARAEGRGPRVSIHTMVLLLLMLVKACLVREQRMETSRHVDFL